MYESQLNVLNMEINRLRKICETKDAEIEKRQKHIDQMSCCCAGCTKHNANIGLKMHACIGESNCAVCAENLKCSSKHATVVNIGNDALEFFIRSGCVRHELRMSRDTEGFETKCGKCGLIYRDKA